MAVHLAITGDVFDGFLFCAVFFPHDMSRMRSGTELSQFLRIFPTYSCIGVYICSDRLVENILWLVGCFGFNDLLRQTVFQSISGRLPKRGRQRREKIDESKNFQITPSRTYCKRNRPLPYYYPN